MRYDEYKITDYPWFNSIPVDWKLYRNGLLFTPHQNKVGDNFSQYNLLSLTTTGIRVKNIDDVRGKVPASYEGYQEVNEGDIVFCLFDLDCSAVFSGISKYKGMITSAYDVVKPNNELANSRFLDYWFQFVFSGRYYKIYSKSVRYTINYDIFKMLKTPVPPRTEQEQIVRFLDWQVSKINRLIAGKKKEIALLQEAKEKQIHSLVWEGVQKGVSRKDSGIDYIGDVPSNWKVLLNHRVFSSVSRKFEGKETVLSLSQKDGLIPYENMTERSLHTSSYDNWQLVLPNDLVLNRFKAHLGVFFHSEYRGIVTFHYGVYKARMPLYAKYYECLYHTANYRRVYAGQSRGMTVSLQNLSDTNFYSTYTVYPPYEEQAEIVRKIENAEAEFSVIIKRINTEIDTLHEMRTKLISDVVTGQLDVRNIEIPDYEYVEEEVDNADDVDEEDEETDEQEEE